MVQRIAIVGAGHLGQQLRLYIADDLTKRHAGFFDDFANAQNEPLLLGKLADISNAFRAGKFDALLMGIGYDHLKFRMQFYDQMRSEGIQFATLIHPTAFVHPTAQVGDGSVIFPRCIVDLNSSVGPNVLLNSGCTIAHDAEIHAGTIFGPGVTLSGFVKIGRECFIGSATSVRDRIEISEGCQTGVGSVVVKNLSANLCVAGVPAKPLRR